MNCKGKYVIIIISIFTLLIFLSSIAIGSYTVLPDSDNRTIESTDESTELTTVYDNSESSNISAVSVFELYNKYGITYDSKEDAIFYESKRVKQFLDGGAYYRGGGFWCDAYYNDKSGVSYLHVTRNGRGSIQGIEMMPKDMLFQVYGQNDVLDFKPNQDFNESDLENIYNEFSKYGIVYDKTTDTISYNGQQVKAFVDGGSKYSDSGYWFNINFYNDTSNSSLYMSSVRDKNGKIIGVEQMNTSTIEKYYGTDGILVPNSNSEKLSDKDDVQSVFGYLNLPQLPSIADKSGDYYFFDNQDSKVQAVAKWKNATGKFNLCDILNDTEKDIEIIYEIDVIRGSFNFICTNAYGESVLISENVGESSSENAYDCGAFKLKIPAENSKFSFICDNSDINIRIVINK